VQELKGWLEKFISNYALATKHYEECQKTGSPFNQVFDGMLLEYEANFCTYVYQDFFGTVPPEHMDHYQEMKEIVQRSN
jgi:hypothetical protein